MRYIFTALLVFFVFIAGNIQAKEDTPPQKILNLAEQGDAKAQFDLGVMYDTGKGAPQDYKQAFYWYTKAAEQGNSYAQSNLGVMYDTGKGVSQDYTKAFAWLSLASAQGIINAKNNLDFVRKKLNQSELVEAQELSNKYYKLYVEPFQ